ncbi:hypothetical protein C9427_32420 [Mesorhizobium helmanticense]|uniref:Uncharacterized protein n=1 Tax=Mesorhizobium helmanticense TaxID=1776423 RepID=A0A2T4IL24_9HYPH|nr:hypothetical protein C9427_32420 [Mesorhizobium helmanticense]
MGLRITPLAIPAAAPPMYIWPSEVWLPGALHLDRRPQGDCLQAHALSDGLPAKVVMVDTANDADRLHAK